jgi:hypothetical protein
MNTMNTKHPLAVIATASTLTLALDSALLEELVAREGLISYI